MRHEPRGDERAAGTIAPRRNGASRKVATNARMRGSSKSARRAKLEAGRENDGEIDERRDQDVRHDTVLITWSAGAGAISAILASNQTA
jgi:hypothetical protein